MEKYFAPKPHADAVDRYLGAVERDAEVAAGAPSGGDAAVFSRCDAVMALVPRLGEPVDLAWAYDEARRLARTPPKAAKGSPAVPWYLSPGLAWTAAGVLAAALVVTSFPRPPAEFATSDPDARAATTTAPRPPIANITFAPIVISTELAQMLAEIDPVVLLAGETPVDSRSLAVLPFAEGPNAAVSRDAAAVAESLYRQVVGQLSAVPGIVLIDTATAAIYADSGLSPEEIALQLGVRGIVEGRIDSVNGEIRFELRLTDAAAAGSSLDEAIERPAEELAMLQSDIASSVIGALARTRPQIRPNSTL